MQDARKFNARMARSLGWEWALLQARLAQLPKAVVTLGDALREHGAGSEMFAKAVGGYQRTVGLPADNMLGAGTWRQVQQTSPKVSNALVIAGIHFPVLADGVQVDPMERYQFTGQQRGCKERHYITVHWGGYDVPSCWYALENLDRDGDGDIEHYGTHIMIEPELSRNGILVAHQAVDLANTTWHAKGVNFESIGIDICRSPLVENAHRYSDAEIIDNPSFRGEKQVVALSPEYGAAVGRLLYWLARLFDLPFDGWPGDKVLSKTALKKHRGPMGHHNVSDRKWDIAPHMDRIPSPSAS